MFGRGAVDMKGGIACFIAAVARHVETKWRPEGLGLTADHRDEEGRPSTDDKAARMGGRQGRDVGCLDRRRADQPEALGDMIKIGRRGACPGGVIVNGRQGPQPIRSLPTTLCARLMTLVDALLHPVFDNGTKDFQPTNLEVTSIDVGNPATNVIPAKATATFNIRFNDTWTAETVGQNPQPPRPGGQTQEIPDGQKTPVDYELAWRDRPSHVFLTRDDRLIETLGGSVKAVIGRKPALSTSGGTSDARFIKTIVRWSSSGWSARRCTWSMNASSLPTWRR